MEPSGAETAVFKNRKPWLVFFGILEILIGVVCFLMLALTVAAMVFARKTGNGADAAMTAKSLGSALAIYGMAGVFFTAMGIGSILARRWARAIMLVASAVWLLSGLMGMVAWVVMLPVMRQQMQQSPTPMPEGVLRVTMAVLSVFMAVIYIILPGLFTFFYSRRNVKATCEALDPVQRWTDRSPLPVLAISLMLGWGALSMLMMLPYGIMPCFGILVTGVPSMIIALVVAACCAWAAVSVHRLQPAGWWCALALVVVGFTSTAVTFARMGLADFYKAMGFSAEQLEAAAAYSMFDGPRLVLWSAVPAVCFVVYLVWARRFFRAAA